MRDTFVFYSTIAELHVLSDKKRRHEGVFSYKTFSVSVTRPAYRAVCEEDTSVRWIEARTFWFELNNEKRRKERRPFQIIMWLRCKWLSKSNVAVTHDRFFVCLQCFESVSCYRQYQSRLKCSDLHVITGRVHEIYMQLYDPLEKFLISQMKSLLMPLY